MMKKECISCGESGHTYLQCKNVNFMDIMHQAFSVKNLLAVEAREADKYEFKMLLLKEHHLNENGIVKVVNRKYSELDPTDFIIPIKEFYDASRIEYKDENINIVLKSRT